MIKEISFKDTIAIRHQVLRKGKPVETCFFEGDMYSTTKHFGIFDNDILVGIASVFKNKNANFDSNLQFQIRGMAILDEFQNKGFGKQLLTHCEKHIENQEGKLIWFNARANAILFYEKLNYKKIGNSFQIESVGEHYIMEKEI